MIAQQTLRNEIRAAGVGLRSRAEAVVTLRPAPPGHGIQFVRAGEPTVLPARAEHACIEDGAIVLGEPGHQLRGVEHLLAAFVGLGIDNALVEVDGPELPIMDGSSAPYVFLIQSAGMVAQGEPRRYLKMRERVSISAGGRLAVLEPPVESRSGCRFDYRAGEAGEASIGLTTAAFVREVSRARAFGYLAGTDEIAQLDLGGCLEQTSAETPDAPSGAVRFSEEFTRHGLLCAIGDLYLLGYPLIGRYRGDCAGHDENLALVRAILADPGVFEIVDARSVEVEGLTVPHRAAGSAAD